MAKTFGSYSTYATPDVINASAAGKLAADLAVLLSLIPDGLGAGLASGDLPPNAGGTPGAPDFGMIHPDMAAKLRIEITQIATNTALCPTS